MELSNSNVSFKGYVNVTNGILEQMNTNATSALMNKTFTLARKSGLKDTPATTAKLLEGLAAGGDFLDLISQQARLIVHANPSLNVDIKESKKVGTYSLTIANEKKPNKQIVLENLPMQSVFGIHHMVMSLYDCYDHFTTKFLLFSKTKQAGKTVFTPKESPRNSIEQSGIDMVNFNATKAVNFAIKSANEMNT